MATGHKLAGLSIVNKVKFSKRMQKFIVFERKTFRGRRCGNKRIQFCWHSTQLKRCGIGWRYSTWLCKKESTLWRLIIEIGKIVTGSHHHSLLRLQLNIDDANGMYSFTFTELKILSIELIVWFNVCVFVYLVFLKHVDVFTLCSFFK